MDSIDKITTTQSGTIAYTVSGLPDGSPVILMHGWGCNRSTVISIAKILEPFHKVFNIDFPGFGQSPEPSDIWGVEDYTRLIEDLAKHESIDNPILIGHSFGGRVAIMLASKIKVDKIVLIDAAGVKPSRSLGYYARIYAFKTFRNLARLLLPRAKAEALIERYRSRHSSADYRQASPLMRSIMSRVVNEDLREYMPQISAPTLLIWGANDTATPLRDARIMEKLIPGSALIAFEGCGHYSFLDNPIQFKAIINSFLNTRNQALQ